jgi:hypothetical protein
MKIVGGGSLPDVSAPAAGGGPASRWSSSPPPWNQASGARPHLGLNRSGPVLPITDAFSSQAGSRHLEPRRAEGRLTADVNAFGFELHRQVAEPAANTVTSPLSAAVLLAMLAAAAGGTTADEMVELLGWRSRATPATPRCWPI